MITKRLVKHLALLVTALVVVGAAGFWPTAARAQTSGIGAGGASNIIGLPSSGSHFQNAASQAQSSAFSNPVGGSSLLQEDKSALIIVDAPAYTGSSVEPTVSNANVWWVYILVFVALLSLIGIALVFLANKYGQESDQQDAVQEDVAPVQPATETAPAEVLEPEEADATEDSGPDTGLSNAEIEKAISQATESSGIQIGDFEEEVKEMPQKGKKRSHSGRPTKKSRK